MKWKQPKSAGDVPQARSGHTFTHAKEAGKIFMFGGQSHSLPPGPCNDLYCLDVSEEGGDGYTWSKIPVAADGPAARWHHSTTAISPKHLYIFGGFAAKTRLDDAWLLDTDDGSMTALKPTPNAPSARGAHTANIVGSKLYLFAGYGGKGAGRRDFNGVHALDLDMMEWSNVQTAGEPPAARSGHQTCVVRTKMYVFGGWNCVEQLSDVCILDTDGDTPTWSVLEELAFSVPRWNFSAVAVWAVPHYKIFVFGGNSGDLNDNATSPQGVYLNDVHVLDTGNNTWGEPLITGTLPSPRADTELVFDADSHQLMLFGGWANQWFGDLHFLDCGEIVGPPYSILTIEPTIGAVTGETKVKVTGMNFGGFIGEKATIRFACAKAFADSEGTVIDATTIECESPNFEATGPVAVEVRVSMGKEGMTNTACEYKFHSVSSSSTTLCYGPGALAAGNRAGTVTSFVIQSQDSKCAPRDTGGDKYSITVDKIVPTMGVDAKGNPKKLSEEEIAELRGEPIEASVVDQGDGTYIVSYCCPTAGEFDVNVNFDGTFQGEAGAVRGCPFRVTQDDTSPEANNTLGGPLMLKSLKDSTRDVKDFSNTTLRNLRKEIPKGQLDPLIKVKQNLVFVENRKKEIDYAVDTTTAALNYLKNNGGHVDREIKAMSEAGDSWVELQTQAPVTQAAIVPETKTQAMKTQATIIDYEKYLNKEADAFRVHDFWQADMGEDKPAMNPESARESIAIARRKLKEEKATLAFNTELCSLFDFDDLIVASNKMVETMDRELGFMETVWNITEEASTFVNEAKEQLWTEVRAEALEDEAKRFMKITKGLHKDIRWCKAYTALDKMCKDFLLTVPLISSLHHKSMRIRHWGYLQKATGKEFTPPPEDPDITLGALLDLNLHEFSADVEEICDQAIKEEKMEVQLALLKTTYAGVEWIVSKYQETDIPQLVMNDEDFEVLEADQLIVQGMMASRYLAQFEEEVTTWQHELSTVAEVIVVLTETQRTWSYLEPLFIGSEEVKKELPETAAKFKMINDEVIGILRTADKDTNIKKACNHEGLLDEIEGIVTQLNGCKKSLADFLDGRRRQFPRFYFTSEADLLDLLSNGNQPDKIIVHVPKIYLATKTMTLVHTSDDPHDRPTITHMTAGVGVEHSEMEPHTKLDGKIEFYLEDILQAQRHTLFEHTKRSIKRYLDLPRVDWLMHGGKSPSDIAQVCLLVTGVYYVNEVEDTFQLMMGGDSQGMKTYSKKQIQQLRGLIALTTTDLNKQQRMRVMCTITLDAHSRDIVLKMVRDGVGEVLHFQWQSQLKQKWRQPFQSYLNRDPTLRGDKQERAEIAILNAVLPYDFEYLGNGPRLVVTPLTDRIYVTATQALNLMLGCAPAGPAGTGKTESTKDLASALGKVCYVFNCSPEMDYKSMGNIYKGLASSGSWGCFDEFNRLIPEVLSVCSVQFKAVLDGIQADTPTCTVEGDEVSLDPTCGAFITMNPGYLGRSELPEGLKALFRPITVMVPDLVLICENMMMSEGYEDAKPLASKFYGLYSLLGQLLSKQLHYDWGLRAVKSVLVVAGGFKRAEPDVYEANLLMRALRDFNIPKIPMCDQPIFFGLLGDLFPGINPPRLLDELLEESIRKACVDLNYFPDETFCLKCVQLEELLAIRHCVMVMGSAGAGKSSTWRTLRGARNYMGAPLKTSFKDFNPKSISTKELYGYITMATREWRDGLLSKIMRDLGLIPDELPKWLLLDGDLDANWIESMNSVMDDNKMLTLASNERIPLKPHMKMIFEIRDLKHATPATVSRAGILYISTDDGYQYRALIISWLKARADPDDMLCPLPKEIIGILRDLFDEYVDKTVFEKNKAFRTILPVEDITHVTSLLYMLERLLPQVDFGGKKKGGDDEDEGKKADEEQMAMPDIIATIFVFSIVWAFGCSMTLSDDGNDYQKLFSEWWRGEWKKVKFPSRDTVFDYWLDPKTWKFEAWVKSPYFYVVDYNSIETPMGQVTVPTSETCAVDFWMANMVENRRGVMLAGPAGTGKTQMIMGMLNSQDPTERVSCIINFNFYTDSTVLQTTMEVPLEKKTGSNYGPPGNTKMIYFIDDVNLPEVDKYMTQDAISLLRQQIEYEHVYDRQKLTVKSIAKTQMVSGMNPTAGSFAINPRLQRWFCTFAIGMPGPTSLLTIYQTFLDGHLSHNMFPEEVQEISTNLIKAALGLHAQVAMGFRKTAANFHYEFNVRHLSNVFQGLLVSKPIQFKTADKFVQLWLHESERVYGDRLVSGEDLAKYLQMAQAQCKKNFPANNVAKFFASENAEPLIFCHFAENIQDKCYDQITQLSHLQTLLTDALHEYNDTNTVMDLVLFEDALKHVCRVVRIVLNEGGHALLVGVGGSGKQSLSRLSAFICGYTVKQIVISSTYGINDLKEDLKWMYNKAGLRDEGIMFLMTDSQITNEKFLIYLNDLLASGDIPDLFGGEELDAVINGCMPKVKALGKEQNKANAWIYFIGEIRKNLHCSLCFSPVGDDFRNRASKFPALCNCTVIDWFQPWPRDALYSVGKKFLEEVHISSDTVRAGVENFMPFSFDCVNKMAGEFLKVERRFVYTTPKSYLELLKLYQHLMKEKVHASEMAIDRLEGGLLKLKETGSSVAKLEEDLKVSLVAAEEKKIVSEGIAEVVAREKAIVENETAKAEIEAKAANVIQTEVTIKQRDTEADLAKAEPAVAQAMAALDSLNKKDLSECKTMSKPPGGVDDVFASTMILLAGVHPQVVVQKNGKVKDRSWDAAKKQLLGSIPEYLDALKGFKAIADAGAVPNVNWKEVRPYLELEHFDPEIIKGKNSAAAGLCSWVINIVMYYDIVTTVEPKRKALAEANEMLEGANNKLKEVTELVAELQSKLDALIHDLNEANATKQEAMDSVERGHKKLDLAQRLINALASENVRWAANVVQMKIDEELLVGDVLLASAFVSYIGPFTKTFRDILLEKKMVPYLLTANAGESIPMSEDANPVNLMVDAAAIAVWQGQGLPADAVSTENACIVCNSARWPLIIDPQLQGIAWLKQKESDPSRSLEIVRLGQKGMLRKLERAIENGFSILIENLDERIDAVITPVIQRAKTKKGHKYYVKLGDSDVEFHDNFKMFLHTKLGNPHFPPEVQAETTLVNFTVTILGLEDQLLALVVKKERPDLAQKSEELVVENRGFKIKIKELEDQILAKLAAAEGDVTEDVELIEGLEDAKRIAADIAVKMELAEVVSSNILITSEKYRPVASRVSVLFFLMNDLVKIHTYYIYSLAAFTKVFYAGIDAVTFEAEEAELGEDEEGEGAEGGEDGEEAVVHEMNDEELGHRCVLLEESITITVFSYIRRGLFNVDKLTVSTQLAITILVKDLKLDPEECSYLIDAKVHKDPGNIGPLAEWMTESMWAKVKALEGMKCFNGLGDAMQADCDEWRIWFDNEQAENAKIPGDFKDITLFAKLVLLRAMRADRLCSALDRWVGTEMGKPYIQQPPFDMLKTMDECVADTPVFFVLFPGVDPTPWVEDVGIKKGFTISNGRFVNISMGQGQEAPAEAVLSKFGKEGGWVMFQNCHLMQSWVPALERQFEIVCEDIHPEFRMFLSAEPPTFSYWKNMPESLMQSCIKVANEAPSDIQSNLRASWALLSQERIDLNSKPREFKGCIFAVCWFHSMVLGRRKFGQQGWSRKYPFNAGDFKICSDVLTTYLDNNNEVPWEDLRYIFCEIMYGGHITDSWDRRTCSTYLDVLFTDGIFKKYEFGKGFASPDPDTLDYQGYASYIETEMVPEIPPLFGLHANAEIGYLTVQVNNLFSTILNMSGGDSAGGGGGGSKAESTMNQLMEEMPEYYEMVGIGAMAKELNDGEEGPFVQVALQEFGRMNVLLTEMTRSLIELGKGLKGQLNMSIPMEELKSCLGIDMVPGRNPFHSCSWEKIAWFSMKPLGGWFRDITERCTQLSAWAEELVRPFSLWLPGTFNPTAYLTAVMQVTARSEGLPLDKMTVETHASCFWSMTECDYHPHNGAFVHGLFIEGARWPTLEEIDEKYDIDGTHCGGHLTDSLLKQLLPLLPVMYVKAVTVQPTWEPSAVGYLRHDPHCYECPMYTTGYRGPTYIQLATLHTQDPCWKWTLAGVAVIFQSPE
jgi:dynein heavy chain